MLRAWVTPVADTCGRQDELARVRGELGIAQDQVAQLQQQQCVVWACVRLCVVCVVVYGGACVEE